MAILKTSWGTKRKASIKKIEEKIVPEKKKAAFPEAEDSIMEVNMDMIEDLTAEEFIATLPKKQRRIKKINIDNQE